MIGRNQRSKRKQKSRQKQKSTFSTITLAMIMMIVFLPGAVLAEESDITPPEWAAGYPKASFISDKEFTLEARGNVAGTIYYVRLEDGASAPTAEQVAAGEDASGNSLAYRQAGKGAVNTGGSSGLRVKGLIPETPYDVYVVLKDEAGNLQAEPTLIEVTTTLPDANNSGIIQPINPGTAGNKMVTLTLKVQNAEGVASPGYEATDFSVQVDGIDRTFAADPFSHFADSDNQEGKYFVTLKGDADNKEYTLTNLKVFGVVIEAGPITVKTPPPMLDAATDLTWDSTIPGKAKWKVVPNASNYKVQLYKGDTKQGTAIHVSADATEHDFTETITAEGDGSYTFKVTAIGDGGEYGDSSSVASNPYNYTAAATPISIPVIAGVTPPVTGATPVTTITATDQYTGTVSWSPEIVDGKFATETEYTATITLTPELGYTFTGVDENFFTVAEATSVTSDVDSDVVTAVFPETVAVGGPTGTAAWNNYSPLPYPNIIEDVKYIDL